VKYITSENEEALRISSLSSDRGGETEKGDEAICRK
jgi:hypothetical protein